MVYAFITLKLKVGVNPPSTGTWKRVGIWGVYDTILTKSSAKIHIYTMYNGMSATTNIRVSDSKYQNMLLLTDCGLASIDASSWFINSGFIYSGLYPGGRIQIPVNTNTNLEFTFNDGYILPEGGAHEFNKNSIFSFSVKITDFSNSSYKHQYVEWEKTA